MGTFPLSGLRVLDATQVMAGPFCTLLLADMGADVIKVEKRLGDDSRRMGPPFINGESAAFLGINRNKRGIVLDLQHEHGREVFRRLATKADVVAESFRPGVMERLGLGAEALRKTNPAMIYVSVSGFGQTGPYAKRAGYDLIAQGMSGIMSVTGYPGLPPVKVSVPLADLNAGMFAAYGVLCAYIHRLKTGQGQTVETSLLEAAIAYTVWEAAELWGSEQTPRPKGSAHRLVAPYQAVASADGYFNIGCANQATWARLCAAIGRPDLQADPRFATNPDRVRHYEELGYALEETTRAKPSAHWLRVLEEAGVPAGPIYDIAQVFDDAHVRARGMVQRLEHPLAGAINAIGIPVKLSLTPGEVRVPAPTLGQHTRQVLEEAGFAEAEIARVLAGD